MAYQATFAFESDIPPNFHGFAQFRESECSPEVFYVCGFDSAVSGRGGQYAVLTTAGSGQWVCIEARDRITIAGRKYVRQCRAH